MISWYLASAVHTEKTSIRLMETLYRVSPSFCASGSCMSFMFALRTSLSHFYRAHPQSRILAISTRWTALIRFMTMPGWHSSASLTLSSFPSPSRLEFSSQSIFAGVYLRHNTPRLIPVVKPSDPAGLLFISLPLSPCFQPSLPPSGFILFPQIYLFPQ